MATRDARAIVTYWLPSGVRSCPGRRPLWNPPRPTTDRGRSVAARVIRMVSKHHGPGCPLSQVNWLRHAIAAIQNRLGSDNDFDAAFADALSAESLLNALEHFTGSADWESVTLADVTSYASLISDARFGQTCTCP